MLSSCTFLLCVCCSGDMVDSDAESDDDDEVDEGWQDHLTPLLAGLGDLQTSASMLYDDEVCVLQHQPLDTAMLLTLTCAWQHSSWHCTVHQKSLLQICTPCLHIC